ncbi:hypothetical protein F4820DRAFT_454362 [Hypoxylon rubiginosum]|uniref:Uncharacterized protein n=1 Tax=Hypoxylon rubiginosum TaxID=110542 RepID=A0ACB9YJ48_9PEZI|nr:hypothetical protein F4820DRAFT_454362 [Hypoxylon rubiginosum]
MKTSFSLILSLLAASAVPGFSAPTPDDGYSPAMQVPPPGTVPKDPPAPPASVPKALEGRVNVDVVLPKVSEDFLCNTQPNSAGTSNINVALEELKKWDDDKECGPGDGGANVAMVRGDGIRLYMGSTNGQKIGSIKCNALVPTFQKLISSCGKVLNGDSRAGGVAWVPGLEGRTYVFPTSESWSY